LLSVDQDIAGHDTRDHPTIRLVGEEDHLKLGLAQIRIRIAAGPRYILRDRVEDGRQWRPVGVCEHDLEVMFGQAAVGEQFRDVDGNRDGCVSGVDPVVPADIGPAAAVRPSTRQLQIRRDPGNVRRMARKLAALALLLGLFAPGLAGAATEASAFMLTTTAGRSKTYAITGYEFLHGGREGKGGKVELYLLIPSAGLKSPLKKGVVKATELHAVATIPRKINVTYKFSGDVITSVSFVTGSFEATAIVDLSFRKLTT